MRKTILLSVAAVLFYAPTQIWSLASYTSAKAQAMLTNQVIKGKKTVRLKVSGMTCPGCAVHIHKALSTKAGIIEDEVRFPGDSATVKYDPEKISEEEIMEAIEKEGYEAEIIYVGKAVKAKKEPKK